MIRVLLFVAVSGLAVLAAKNAFLPPAVPAVADCLGCPYGHQCDPKTGAPVRPRVERPSYSDEAIAELALEGACKIFSDKESCVRSVTQDLKKQITYWGGMGIAVEISSSGQVLCETGMNPYNECQRRDGYLENMAMNEFFQSHMRGVGGNAP